MAALNNCVLEIVEVPVGVSSQSAITLAAPAAVVVKSVVATPLEFVVAVVALRMPLPLATVNLTVCPGTGLPLASFAVAVKVAGVPVLTVFEGVVKVSVEPVIGTGNVLLAAPAIAVMVAVRLVLFAVPEVKVTVALPVASVVTV